MTNFGHEYVWHCHILSHEENDMMRPVIFNTNREDGNPLEEHRNMAKMKSGTWKV